MIPTDFGTLQLPTVLPAEEALTPLWINNPINIALVVVSVILALLGVMDLLHIGPRLIECLSRSKGNISMEHSMQSARARNLLFWLLFPSACLITDRYRIYSPEFMDNVPMGWSVFVVAGVLLAFLAIRGIAYLFAPSRLRGEENAAAKGALRTYMIIAMVLMLPSIAIASYFGASDSGIRLTILIEACLMYLISIVRTGQILSNACGGFATFLYLCTLELLPAGLLAASVFVL